MNSMVDICPVCNSPGINEYDDGGSLECALGHVWHFDRLSGKTVLGFMQWLSSEDEDTW